MSQPTRLGSLASVSPSSSSTDSEDGGVLLAEYSPPLAQSSEKEKEVAAWLSSVVPPSPALKQVKKTVRFADVKPSPSTTQRSRTSPYAITFPSSSSSKPATKPTPTTTSSANAPLTPYHLNIIDKLISSPYEGVCPFITATACPQGPKCALKVMKPSTVTLCPVYLKVTESNCRSKSVQHQNGFSHKGDEGFEDLMKLKELRGVHQKGEWGV